MGRVGIEVREVPEGQDHSGPSRPASDFGLCSVFSKSALWKRKPFHLWQGTFVL